jgi:hypothetical protein
MPMPETINPTEAAFVRRLFRSHAPCLAVVAWLRAGGVRARSEASHLKPGWRPIPEHADGCDIELASGAYREVKAVGVDFEPGYYPYASVMLGSVTGWAKKKRLGRYPDMVYLLSRTWDHIMVIPTSTAPTWWTASTWIARDAKVEVNWHAPKSAIMRTERFVWDMLDLTPEERRQYAEAVQA